MGTWSIPLFHKGRFVEVTFNASVHDGTRDASEANTVDEVTSPKISGTQTFDSGRRICYECCFYETRT